MNMLDVFDRNMITWLMLNWGYYIGDDSILRMLSMYMCYAW
jgi:hypothetical protein